METKLSTFEEVAANTPRKVIQFSLETIGIPSSAPLSEIIGRLTAISNRIESKQLGFDPIFHYEGYHDHAEILISKQESDEEYNKRVAKALTQKNAKEMREIDTEKHNAERIRLKYDHYMEMKLWALQCNLPL
jgi:hypothetical protein